MMYHFVKFDNLRRIIDPASKAAFYQILVTYTVQKNSGSKLQYSTVNYSKAQHSKVQYCSRDQSGHKAEYLYSSMSDQRGDYLFSTSIKKTLFTVLHMYLAESGSSND